jgi:ribose transport system substrate-binding protein
VLNKLNNKNKRVCMVGLYAYNPKACVLAVRAMQDKKFTDLKIVGFDEDTVTLDAISKGEIVGTVVQDPFEYGYQAVKALAAAARGDKTVAEKLPPIPYRVITKDGAERTHNGAKEPTMKATDFAQQLSDRLKSVK